MASPSLTIRRIVVEGELSCDLIFDNGLNIIQAVPRNGDPKSTNSSGKTALVELIQHGLGKRQKSKSKWHFKSIIDEVHTLWLEVEANGKVLTIERSLQKITAAALLHEGPYVPGIVRSVSELVSIEDLSNVLLSALNIPRVSVKTEEGDLTPLSFPLLMRAFILHQEDSFLAILDKVQPDKRRADILGFLSGITPIERFSIEEELSKLQIETQELESYFQFVQKFLIDNDVPSLIEADAQLSNAERSLHAAREAQLEIQQKIRQEVSNKPFNRGIGRIDSLRSQVFGIKEQLAQIEHEFTGLQKEEDRLEELYASLTVDHRKAQRLNMSTTVLSSIEFGVCPRCLSEITTEMHQREQYGRCCLCNRPLTITSDTLPRATPRIEDINAQLEEAAIVLKNVHKEKGALLGKIKELGTLESEISQTLDAESQAYVSPSLDWLLAQAYEVAQRESDLAHTKALFDQAEALGQIKNQLEQLQVKLALLEDRLKEASKPNRERLEVFRQIYEHILRTVDFPGFKSCSIDARTLMPEISGSSYSSEGTALKALSVVCYHLALLELARREQTFFPLMLVIDSPAFGDMNEESYDKLLHYLSSLQHHSEQEYEDKNKQPDWQIILTTRKIISELDPYIKDRISNAPNQKLLRSKT